MTQDETLAWLTGAFSAKRLIAIRKALGGPKPELTVYLNGSLEAVGFPEPDSAEAMEGAFKCWLHEGGSSFECVFAKPDKTTQAIGGANQDWVAISLSLDGSTAGFASLGYLYKTNAVTLGSGVVYIPLASAIGLVGLAASATYNESAADQSAVPYSRNPIASEVILKALSNLTVGISADAQGNVDILGNLQVTQGLTVDGSLNANGSASTFNGDVLVKGNAIVNGTITQKTFLVDTDIPVTFSDNAKGIISSYYARARATGDKLSIVFAFYMPSNSVEQKTITKFTALLQTTILTLPSSVLGKLYPSPIDLLDIKSVEGQTKGYGKAGVLKMGIRKYTSGLSIELVASEDIVQGSSELAGAIWRFEFNFILS